MSPVSHADKVVLTYASQVVQALVILAIPMLESGCAGQRQRALASTISMAPSAPLSEPPAKRTPVIRGDPFLASIQLGPVEGDCNVNGVADSLDIASGMDDDANHNGLLDICDPDSVVRRASDRWPSDGVGTTRVSLRVRHRSDGVHIQYAIPTGGGTVSLDVRNAGGDVVRTFHAGRHPAGRFQILWDKTLPSQEPTEPGTFIFKLQMGRERLQQRLRWEM